MYISFTWLFKFYLSRLNGVDILHPDMDDHCSSLLLNVNGAAGLVTRHFCWQLGFAELEDFVIQSEPRKSPGRYSTTIRRESKYGLIENQPEAVFPFAFPFRSGLVF
ncbi:hypothetical protein Dsin_005182 [Dipteronia sinensis]|uniref:Uncharacterized protein n=1 Tax=Dipteronia sinensis TaxID=43782 RepID=A0AAE0AWX6_9ROSI|nr:hypothetical protein Dsin_005182 [Dipteronia sinensis]